MNVFEDLIVELKQENLLERTASDSDQFQKSGDDGQDGMEDSDLSFEPSTNGSQTTLSATESDDLDKVETEGYVSRRSDDEPLPAMDEPMLAPKKVRNGQEFYRKRAVGEVSNLQMVEHVLTGVEREYLKIVPNVFDDFEVKKALNTFIQVTENEHSTEHQEAEFYLMQETEAWCTVLANRDRTIPVSSLRQYCERSRPPLSSQALVALSRFYRNLPYSEIVRAKFDFVITRLFSRPTENDRRDCLFTPDEMFAHISTLYREWSSIALYNADDDESNVLLTALSFDELAIEAENARSLDELIEKDFFSRLRTFKESISELFYAPTVTAAAIDANVRVGNAYVALVERERQKMDDGSIRTKYGDLHDDSVSDAAARTLELVELLRERPTSTPPVVTEVSEKPVVEYEKAPVPVVETEQKPNMSLGQLPFIANIIENAFSVNKWLLSFSILLIAASFGIFIYSNFFITENLPSTAVKALETENSVFKEHVKTARISGETFYGLLLPSWDALPKEKRQEFLQKVYDAGKEKGYRQVNLIGKNGRTAAFASPTRLDVIMP